MCNLIDLQTDLDIEECPNIILDSLESTMFLLRYSTKIKELVAISQLTVKQL